MIRISMVQNENMGLEVFLFTSGIQTKNHSHLLLNKFILMITDKFIR